MKLRNVLIAAALLVTGTVIGATTQHLASATVSSGDRPVLISIVPCRLVDTRPAPNTVGPRSAPLGAADTDTIDVQDPGSDCAGQIPVDATALSLNVTALGATAQSFITIWSDGDRPLAANLNPAPGEPPTPNAVTTSLSSDQEFRIYNDAGSVNVVIDVNGYYVDHDHDDRYLTDAEVQTAIADAREFVHALAGSGTSPSFEPDDTFDTGDPLVVTTTTDGRWILDATFGHYKNCAGNEAWYYLTIDDVVVESSFMLRSDETFAFRSYRGVTERSIEAGEHVVSLAAECRFDDPAGGGGSSSHRTINVTVVP